MHIDRWTARGTRAAWISVISLVVGAGAVRAQPAAGIGVYGGAVAAHQPGISSYGVGGGVDIQYPIDDQWSVNPFIQFSAEHSSASGYDLLDGLGGVQLRRWFTPTWYAGASLASHNTTYRLPGSGVANAASLVAPGLVLGTETPSGYGVHLQLNYELTSRPYANNSGTSSSTNRFSGMVFLTYRWKEDGAAGATPAGAAGSAGFKLSDLLSVSSTGDTHVLVGVSYGQRTYKAHGRDAVPSGDATTLTDNGAASPVLEIYGREKALRAWPMKTGQFVVGWNWNAALGYIDTPYQVTNNGLRGEKMGTKVTGGYLGLAPELYFKVGPLSPAHPIFAKLSLGVGPGLINTSGTGLFGAAQLQGDAGTRGTRLGLYTYAKADLEDGHWIYSFTGSGLNLYTANKASVQTYGFGVGYQFAW